MQAYVYRRYGGPEVVHLEDVPKPKPKKDEILVKVVATTVTAGDWRALTLDMPKGFGPMGRLIFGLTGPRHTILGMEFSGVVEATGPSVTRFRPGDEVFGSTSGRMGAHAQYLTIRENAHVAAKPGNLSFEKAAALSFGGVTALHFLGKARVKPGEKVLVIGASGGTGTAIVQLAKHMGAHVTGVTSTPNLELVRSIGADRVIDYTKENALTGPDRYDVIVDTVGETHLARCQHALREGGRLAAVAGELSTLLSAALGNRTIISGVAPEGPEMAQQIAELAKAGVLRPAIDHRYDFTQMREAHARVASRRKRGNVVVLVAHDTP